MTGTLNWSGDASGNTRIYTYTNEHDEVETYDTTGKLVSITNRAGQTQTLTYSDGTSGANGGYVLDAQGNATASILPAGRLIRVTDPAGRSLQYGYDATGRAVKMIDPAGGVYIYAYDTDDNLTSVTYPDSRVRTYLYGESANVSATPDPGVSYVHALTGIIDESGNRFASWTYDAAGRATSSEHGSFGSGIDHVGFVYGTLDTNGNSTTTVTDVMGKTRSYTFGTKVGVVKNTGITGQPCNGCSSAFTYDAHGNIASRTEFNGNTTCYAYDLTRNLETVRLEGLPAGTACPADLANYIPVTTAGSVERKITTAWNANYRLPEVIAEPLRITTYYYDPATGNLVNKTIRPTSDTTGGAGLNAVTNGTARSTGYTYYATTDARNGLVHTVDGPRTDVNDITTYDYDSATGNLTGVTNALNQLTNLGDYDANGRVGTITDPNGLVTGLTYDARGRLTDIDVGNTGSEKIHYTYDAVGQLHIVNAANGAAYTYDYDTAHRLTDITDNVGNRIHYTLDAAGNRKIEEIFDSTGVRVQTHSRVFDALNRLWKDIGAINQTTVYIYDANGNLKTVTDPLNRQTAYSYDALNRLVSSTDAANGITSYGYDGLDQLVNVTDPRTLSTQYQRDGLGNLNEQISPDTGTTSNTYDAAGNMKTRTDAKGQFAAYTYDALNRLTDIAYSASSGGQTLQTVTYRYDQGTNGIGHLTRITDSTGTTDYSYYRHGRLAAETRMAYGATYATAYAYDAQGRLAGITYPSGRTVDYTFDSSGRISGIRTTFNGHSQVLASDITYFPFGGVQSLLRANGKTYRREYDQDGRIASYTLNNVQMAIGYDAASQIRFITDPAMTNIANYDYNSLSQLTSYTQGTVNQGFDYDPNGNRKTQTLGSTISIYNYDPASNRLANIQTGASTQTFTQDANGATRTDASRQYAYDVRGRLIQTTTAQGVVNYEVNALGLRVRKQVPYANTDTVYHYDAAGHLIGESEVGDTAYTREYIYLGDLPVAVMQ